MGVYAHRFIEVLDKDNKWQLLPLWSKYKENSYSQPDVVAEDLKLTKQPSLPMPSTTTICGKL